MGALQDLWDEVEHAVAESLGNAEGRASAWYLEHHFRKAGLGVYRLPDDPPTRAAGDLLEALNAQMDVSVQLMRRLEFSDQEISDCTAQARRAIGLATGATLISIVCTDIVPTG